ncbi:hypothetical protein D0B54_08555 [Solimonas sp. K1W22B-7]|uniref:secretin N-terminal domain-containing protein n=1 Tax=Solimonas sp. K1W22B-7 TaxID=2303331 RepID=UPI000E337AEB|nr:secretin N-terminal domain-containing protein [Solimonas sp. K1W22B-7]AXQ28729.1 hypothetical protein D0B54_08555 [Solimonas sp. K1W22B-7]
MNPRALLFCVLLPFAVFAQTSLEVLEPRHRLARELQPLLEPLAGPDGSVSVFDNKLVVRAAPAQLAGMRQLLEQLDRAPRQLMIHVRQGGVAQRGERGAGLSGVYRRGDGSIVVPGPDGRLPRDVELQLRDRQVRDDSSISQQLRVEEGREAQIMLGSSQPYITRERLPNGSVVQRSEYISSGSGFTVLPRLQGERVQLQIQSQQQTPGRGGVIDSRSASSVVSGPLGEWFEIGGAVQQASMSSGALLGYSQGSASSQNSIQVRVELLE